jgi:hypothetical protein
MADASPLPTTTIVVQHKRSPGVFAGVLGCLFAVLGIFTIGPIFIPVAVLCGLVGITMGIVGRSLGGVAMAMLSLVVSGLACLLSPTMWVALGLGGLALAVANHPEQSATTESQGTASSTAVARAVSSAALPQNTVRTAPPSPMDATAIRFITTEALAFNASAGNDLARCPEIERQYENAAKLRAANAPSRDSGASDSLTSAMDDAAQENAKVNKYHVEFLRKIAPLNGQFIEAENLCGRSQADPQQCVALANLAPTFHRNFRDLSACLDRLDALYRTRVFAPSS